jgi:indole-3-glycerol phosphate synthase
MSERSEKLRGVRYPGGVLDKIVRAKADRVMYAKRVRSLESIKDDALSEPRARGRERFSDSISRPGRTNIIAEIKRRSPSRGVIREIFDPVAIAREYSDAGAAAISVLAEEDFFGGSLNHLRAARQTTTLPLLRKDFILDEYQVYESAAAQADAVLLITAILEDGLLRDLINLADDLGMDAIIEVHTEDEMERAARAGARIIGVNNRDLKSFDVDLRTSTHLAARAPAETTLVSESGINTGAEIRGLKSAGFDAFLIGERFMREAHAGNALAALLGEADAA